MVKITDGRTPPANEAYRKGWERIFGKKCCNKPNCCGGHIITGSLTEVQCYHKNWIHQEDGMAIYGRYTKDCPDCHGTGKYFIKKENDGNNL